LKRRRGEITEWGKPQMTAQPLTTARTIRPATTTLSPTTEG